MKIELILYFVGRLGSWLIWVIDNISSHYDPNLIAMYYKKDILLVYILLYSHYFNSIKISFSIIK